MSLALYDNLGGLRFYTEEEILYRNYCVSALVHRVRTQLCNINSAWTFHQVEGPLLTPRNRLSSAYTENDVFLLRATLGEQEASLRAETTSSSYAYAQHLLQTSRTKLPVCVWQVGKSFRRELSDGARASTLRYNEFYQLELQCLYSEGTKADYAQLMYDHVEDEIRALSRSRQSRTVESDRLPSYSTRTVDVEVPWNGHMKEMASISTRTDFAKEKTQVLEIAVGLDRLLAVEKYNRALEPDELHA